MNRSVIYSVLLTVLKTPDSTSQLLNFLPTDTPLKTSLDFCCPFSFPVILLLRWSRLYLGAQVSIYYISRFYIILFLVLFFILLLILRHFPYISLLFSQHGMMERSFLSALHSHICVLFPAGFSELKSSIYK